MQGYRTELITEYAKDMTWQKSHRVLENQLYIFAKQHMRIWRVANQVDIIITDSPLVQNLSYSQQMSDTYRKIVCEESALHDNINIFLKRSDKFDSVGRNQTLEESMLIDDSTREWITYAGQKIDYEIPVGDNTLAVIQTAILYELKRRSISVIG